MSDKGDSKSEEQFDVNLKKNISDLCYLFYMISSYSKCYFLTQATNCPSPSRSTNTSKAPHSKVNCRRMSIVVMEARNNPINESQLMRAMWRRSIPRVLSSRAMGTMRWRKSDISHAKSAKIAPEKNHSDECPNHNPIAAAKVATDKPSHENHPQPRHCVNNHTAPKINVQRAKTTNPDSANPHASDPVLMMIPVTSAITVTTISFVTSMRNRQPDPANKPKNSRFLAYLC